MNETRLDITTTATIRPHILEKTLRSFVRNLFRGFDCRLIINIDPVGDARHTVEDVLAVARKHFSTVIWRIPETAHFTRAVKWTWSQVESDFFFNLEDDWQLVHCLSLGKMLEVMAANPRLAILRLPKGQSTMDRCQVSAASTERKWYIWNGSYWEPPAGMPGNYCGMPSLIRTEWMRPVLKDMPDDVNHERFSKLLARDGDPRIGLWTFGAYTDRDVELTCQDIGRTWRAGHKIERNSEKNLTGWSREGKPYDRTERSA